MMESKRPHASGAGSQVLFGSNAIETSNASAENPTIIDRCIIIGRGLGGSMYLVTVSPPHPDHEPRLFDTHKKARGHACGLRLVNRWAIHDEAEGVR